MSARTKYQAKLAADKAEGQRKADEFNKRYPVGTPVMAYPGIRPDDPIAVAYQKRVKEGRVFGGMTDPCKRLATVTRTPAWILGHGEPVVSVEGYAGGICLSHVDVREVTCGWNPVQATTDCDWDRNCPVHGDEAAS